MSIEGFPKKSDDNEGSFPLITSKNKEGNLVHGVTGPLPEKSPAIPDGAYAAVVRDLNLLPESNEPLKYKQGEYLLIAVNSNEKVRYQVLDAQKGHYLIVKIDRNNIVLNETQCSVFLSNEPINQANPDLIVCSATDIEKWLQ